MQNNLSRREAIYRIAGIALAGPASLLRADSNNKIRIGGLEFEIVEPSATGVPKEYADPNNSGTPLVFVPEKSLNAKISGNFSLGEIARISNPTYNSGAGIKTYNTSNGVYHQFVRIDPKLIETLQGLREDFGKTLRVISPYRNVTYNGKCGGQPKSRHVSGQAIDICPMDPSNLQKLYELADKHFANGGVGYYPNKGFVHVDVRGSRARWKI